MRSLPRLSLIVFALLTLSTRGPIAVGQTSNPGAGTISTVAGVVDSGYSGDGGSALLARMNAPKGIAVDVDGNIYVADSLNNRIRKIAISTGIISTIAGNGNAGYSGDNDLALNATLNNPQGIAVDSSANIYIADSGNSRIRKIDFSTGQISTIAGNGSAGFSGDGGPSLSASLNNPYGLALDTYGNVYIADTANNRVRKLDASTGNISTIAGNGTAGSSGDGSEAVSANLNNPRQISLDKYGNIFVSEGLNHRVREIGLGGIITTVAGIGVPGYSGDGGQANLAGIDNPGGLAVDSDGDLLFEDVSNNRIRKIEVSTGIITSIIGSGATGSSGDNGPAIASELTLLNALSADSHGNVYLVDGNRIRTVSLSSANTSVSVHPMATSFCAPGALNVTTGLPSAGGSWNAIFTYTSLSFPGCDIGAAPLSSAYSWITITYPSLTCSPNPAPLGQPVTCNIVYNASQNTGPARQGTLVASYGSAGSISQNILQYGPLQTLIVNIAGQGIVTSSPSGISCPGLCSNSFSYGTTVNLFASPSSGYTFSGWSGACSGTGACTVPMNSAANVSATFTQLPPSFSIMLINPSQTTPLSLGHSMTYQVAVAPQNGFSGPVTLSLSGVPNGVSYQFSTPVINTSGTAILTLTSQYSSSTYIGSSSIFVRGTSGSTNNTAVFFLQTRPMQYKGTCGVQ